MASHVHTPNTHTRRILIVGAGPAGLATAHYLAALGYDDIQLVDAAATAGGKCISSLHRGVTFDMGAQFAHYGFVRVRELAKAYGIGWRSAPSLVLASADGGRSGRLGLPARRDLATVEALASFARVLVEHRALWHPGFLRFDHGLALPVTEWMEREGLMPLADALLPALAGYGYGYPDELPAGYLLKMLYGIVARHPLDNVRWAAQILQTASIGEPAKLFDPLMFKDGADSLMRAMAERFQPRLDTPVTDVAADDTGVSVVMGGAEARYDAVIFAVPPSAIVNIVRHEGIRSVFAMAVSDTLHSVLLESEAFPDHEAWFLADNGRHGVRRGRPVLVADLNPGSGLVSALAFGADGQEAAAVEQAVRGDLEALGQRPGRVVEHRVWQGFPRATPETFVEFHDRLESLQGLDGLYFTGEVMNAGTLEGAIAYSKSLVDRFF